MQDFQLEGAYQIADDKMKKVLNEMIQRPSAKRDAPTDYFFPTEKAYFAWRLHQEPENVEYLKAEYYYLDYKYQIGSYQDELPICIVAPGRNLKSNPKQMYKQFLDSIARQNYTNYKLVYLDDNSDDQTVT